jgi:hypothetical protein
LADDDGRLGTVSTLGRIELNFAEMMMRQLTITGSPPAIGCRQGHIAQWKYLADDLLVVSLGMDEFRWSLPATHSHEAQAIQRKIVLKVEGRGWLAQPHWPNLLYWFGITGWAEIRTSDPCLKQVPPPDALHAPTVKFD